MATGVERFGMPQTPNVGGSASGALARLADVAKRADKEREKWAIILQNPCDNLRLIYRAVITVLEAKAALADKLGTARHYADMSVATPKKEHDAVSDQLKQVYEALHLQRKFEEPEKNTRFYEAQEDGWLKDFINSLGEASTSVISEEASSEVVEAGSIDRQSVNIGLLVALIGALAAQLLGASFVISCATAAIGFSAMHIASNWGVSNA